MSTPTRPAHDADRLLDTIEDHQRGPFSNVTYHTCRAGAPPYSHASTAPWTPELLCLAVMDELTRRLRQAFRYNNIEGGARRGAPPGMDGPAAADAEATRLSPRPRLSRRGALEAARQRTH
jgi:hypothetical protein